MAKLLIGEDNPFLAAFLQEAVREGGYEVCGVAASAKEFMTLAEQEKPDLAIVDVRLAGSVSGVDAAVAVSSRLNLGILFVTADPQRVLDPPAPVGQACLSKPFTVPELLTALKVVEQIAATGRPSDPVRPKLRLIPRKPVAEKREVPLLEPCSAERGEKA
jgi:DNA-binding response OmpR family regulator